MSFAKFNLSAEILKAIQGLGFVEPTVVQDRVIPEAIEGFDVRACAQTGSGKTIAFVLPIMNKLLKNPSPHRPTILIVVPTRELGTQVISVVKEVSRFTPVKCVLIMGGANMERQIKQIRAGAQIVVATPGRLLDHMRRHTISLQHIHTVVLDEADRMLDMGFLPDIRQILAGCPSQRQTMLFSATYPPEIQQLVNHFLKDPRVIDVSASLPADNVAQMVYPISRSQKEALLQSLLANASIASALIFCRTKHGADHLATTLRRAGKSITVIHSDRSQAERNEAIEGFRNRKYQILVATDIASRGLDIKDISHVINFDVPHHPEDYVHRIGRTGRAQATGDAFTLVAPDEEPYLSRIEKFISKTVPRGVLPDFPYLVPPRLTPKAKTLADSFGKFRRRIPVSRAARFR